MKAKILAGICLCASLFACKKDNDSTTPPSTSVTPVSSISVRFPGTNDSVRYNFTRTDNKLSSLNVISNRNGTSTNSNFTVTRNSSGIITGVSNGTLSNTIGYNAEMGQYTYALQPGSTYKDSTVFLYTGGNITESATYRLVNGTTSYTPVSRQVYTYNSLNNITQVQTYNYVGTTWVLQSTTGYTYDTQTNPLQLNSEALIIAGASTLGAENLSFIGVNNVTGINYQDMISSVNNYTTNYTYTYNSLGQPILATGTSSTGVGTTINYVY
jgi:hypothetical protein